MLLCCSYNSRKLVTTGTDPGQWVCRANDGVARWWRTVNRQHPQHWLTQKLADDIASSPSLGGERQSVLLLPRTAGPRAGLSREPTEAGALQQLTAICNSFATVATSDQVHLPIAT